MEIIFMLLSYAFVLCLGVAFSRIWLGRTSIFGKFEIYQDEENPEFDNIRIRLPENANYKKSTRLILYRVKSLDSPK